MHAQESKRELAALVLDELANAAGPPTAQGAVITRAQLEAALALVEVNTAAALDEIERLRELIGLGFDEASEIRFEALEHADGEVPDLLADVIIGLIFVANPVAGAVSLAGRIGRALKLRSSARNVTNMKAKLKSLRLDWDKTRAKINSKVVPGDPSSVRLALKARRAAFRLGKRNASGTFDGYATLFIAAERGVAESKRELRALQRVLKDSKIGLNEVNRGIVKQVTSSTVTSVRSGSPARPGNKYRSGADPRMSVWTNVKLEALNRLTQLADSARDEQTFFRMSITHDLDAGPGDRIFEADDLTWIRREYDDDYFAGAKTRFAHWRRPTTQRSVVVDVATAVWAVRLGVDGKFWPTQLAVGTLTHETNEGTLLALAERFFVSAKSRRTLRDAHEARVKAAKAKLTTADWMIGVPVSSPDFAALRRQTARAIIQRLVAVHGRLVREQGSLSQALRASAP